MKDDGDKISIDQLKKFTKSVFMSMGCSEIDSEQATEALISADLRGIDSHGIARLIGFVRLWDKGRINSKPNIRIIHESKSTATLDGDGGLGLIVAPRAMEIAMEKANEAGTGWVAVQNSNHFGIGAYHTLKAARRDMIGMAMTNASPLVAPTNSKDRMLGTNPISVAIPSKEEPFFVADFATAAAANGKLEILQRKGELAPFGWLQDKEGNESRDPNILKTGGALLPLGSDWDHGSHKGYCLGSIVDIFSAVLSGANYGPWAPPFVAFLNPPADPVGKGIGHFLGAMRVDAFRPADEFKAHMDNWIRRFRSANPVSDEWPVLIPGDPEREHEKRRLIEGLILLPPVWKDIEELSRKFGLTF